MKDETVLRGLPQCLRALYLQVRFLEYAEEPDYAEIDRSLAELQQRAGHGSLELDRECESRQSGEELSALGRATFNATLIELTKKGMARRGILRKKTLFPSAPASIERQSPTKAY